MQPEAVGKATRGKSPPPTRQHPERFGCRTAPTSTSWVPPIRAPPGGSARVLLEQYTGLDPHQLRHSAATHLGEQKVPLQLIMAKTHHKNQSAG